MSDGLASIVLSLAPTGAQELAYLNANLSGGSGGTLFLYTVNGTVNSSSGVVDSIVDAAGNAPNIASTLTARPAWDAVNRLVTADGVNDNLSWAANNAIADFTTFRALVTIAVVPTGSNSKYVTAVADSAGAARLFGVYRPASAHIVVTSNTDLDTTVAVSTNRRLIIATYNGTTSQTAQVPSVAKQTGAVTAFAAGSNRLTLFDYFPGAGANSNCVWRASLALNYVPTAGDVTVLTTWAQTFHAAVLA